MQVLSLFRPEDAPQPDLAELVALVAAVPGAEFEGRASDDHRLARWRHSTTGASCLIQLGEPPLEVDTLHPPRAYLGWAPLQMSLHLPLCGPHWFCVEGLVTCEALLAADPAWRALDEEDIPPSPSGDAAPGPWSRPRAIASWERLRAAQIETSKPVPRMRRSASVAMWRYRREAHAGALRHPEFHWPPVNAMRDASGVARSACVWMNSQRPVALPPVEFVILAGQEPVVVAYEDLLDGLVRAGDVSAANLGGATLAKSCSKEVLAALPRLPRAGLIALDDESWCD